jgi:hypothetical protein
MKIFEVTEALQNANDMDHLIQRVSVVANICTQMGNKPLMYRQVTGVFPNTLRFIVKVTPQENRKYHGNDVNPAQQKVIQALSIRNPVWATLEPHTGTRGPFGENHIMIPIGDYKIHHSSEVQDLGKKSDADQFLSTYKTGWPDPGHGDNEVIVDCVNYYIINVGDFVGKYAGKKAKDIVVDKSSFNDWNNLNTKLLKARFGTYTDVGWYLSNPVTNYFMWLKEKQESKT